MDVKLKEFSNVSTTTYPVGNGKYETIATDFVLKISAKVKGETEKIAELNAKLALKNME
ncbi:hypothetical protein [Neobacillus sp. SAB-20_R2A]|uniref:hypothetical protein n=1 Tax=Neobacillus sp. SAB-20_R2A TaxID=3120519 RepID=UPI003C6E7B1E